MTGNGKLTESTPEAGANSRKRQRATSPEESMILMDTPQFQRPLAKRRSTGRRLDFGASTSLMEKPEPTTDAIEKLFLDEPGVTGFSKKLGDIFEQSARFIARDVINDLVARMITPNSKGRTIFCGTVISKNRNSRKTEFATILKMREKYNADLAKGTYSIAHFGLVIERVATRPVLGILFLYRTRSLRP